MKFLELKFWEIWYWIRAKFWNKPIPLIINHAGELPDSLEKKYLYLIGENDYLWIAALICPCGCGETIQLNLLSEAKPCWKIQNKYNGTITLVPSVWRKKGCRSHFLIKNGVIIWC